MSVVKMHKVSLLGLNVDKENILEFLMKMGVCEIIDCDEKLSLEEWAKIIEKDGDAVSISNLIEDIEKLRTVIEQFAKSYVEAKGLFGRKREVTKEELNNVLNSADNLWNIVSSVANLNEKLTNLKSRKNREMNLISSLEVWRPLDIPLDIKATKNTVILLGTIPSSVNFQEFKNMMELSAEKSITEIVNKDNDQSYISVIYHIDEEEGVFKVFKKFGFVKVTFKDIIGTVKDNVEIALKLITEIDKECYEIEQEIQALSKNKPNLEVLCDYLTLQKDKKQALNGLAKTDKAFMLEGWIPADLGGEIKKSLVKNWDCIVNIIEPSEDEEFPILLTNKPLAQATESITEMYSLPNFKEIDPNAIMAPFFVLFFGLMLSDGGYGILLALTSLFVKLKFKPEGSSRRFTNLMFFSGLSTILWGALFGSWFGIAQLSKYSLWFDPVKDPEELLKWSLVFGVFHMYVGLGVRGINFIRQKRYLDILFDVVVWYVFFTGFILFVLPFVPRVNPQDVTGLVGLGKYLLIIGGVLVVLTQGRSHKNIFMKLISGLGGLYDLIGFMSDVLSYSRLLALGLATSVIASIVNQMGAMGGLNSIAQIAMFIVVVFIGHAFNFAINALGAYVHSSRLQYIEFFGKFYKGGGKPFVPLKINTKYINLKN